MKISFTKILAVIFAIATLFAEIIYLNAAKTNKTPIKEVVNSNKDCAAIPALEQNGERLVTKIIDGDTFLIEGGYSVRILGIDTDEKNHLCYDKAKERLEELILNKKIILEKEKEEMDIYCRYLRNVFLGEKNIGLSLVQEGLAVARFSNKNSKYIKEIEDAEKKARENKIGCKWEKGVVEEKNENNKITTEGAIGACETKNYIGKEMTIEGEISDIFESARGNTFLHFGGLYPKQCFSAVIFKKDKERVGIDAKEYKGKTIIITGLIKVYDNKPEIILEDAGQIIKK